MINPAIFRAYDIRGNSNNDLSPQVAYKIGLCFAKNIIANESLVSKPLICVGKDGRLSSDILCSALIEGLEAAGSEVKYIGLVPTPLLYFADKVFSADGSVMVTGSHNPKDDNGFKMLKSHSSFFGSMIQELKQQVIELDESDKVIHIDTNSGNMLPIFSQIAAEYIDRIMQGSKISPNLKIAFDPGNGAAAELIKAICQKLPCQTFVINEEIDGNFPAHPPDPTIAENLEQLKEFVLSTGCDIGIGFDGDADRIGIITKQGVFVSGDQLLCFYAKHVLAKNPGATVIADVKTSSILFNYVKALHGNAIMWKTGHSFIKTKMKETGAKLAGEMSGHIFFADDYYGYDDALYAAIRLISIISSNNESLDEFLKSLPKSFNTPEIKIAVKDEMKFTIIEEVKKLLRTKNVEFVDIDGIRATNQNGWWLLRASNTGPYLIARCESHTKEGLKSLNQDLKIILDKYGIELFQN